MHTDPYTKAILTIIAAALATIAWRGEIQRSAHAQFSGPCGTKFNPCYIAMDQHNSLNMNVTLNPRDILDVRILP